MSWAEARPARSSQTTPWWREQVAAEDRATAGVETTTSDPGTIIAIVDTGVNPIPDLEGALVPGYDFIDNDLESQDVDSHELASPA